MATYATQEEFEAYVPGWVTDNPDELEKVLERAERDIDMALGRYGPVDSETGLKLAPSTLEEWRRRALSNATCAQAYYRIIKGHEFFVEQRPLDPSGPDGSQKGREPFIAPQADQELSYGQLYRLVGYSRVEFPNQNVHDYIP